MLIDTNVLFQCSSSFLFDVNVPNILKVNVNEDELF